MLNDPVSTFLAHFWRSLRDELHFRGCTSDDLPSEYRKLPYTERVRIERVLQRKSAIEFVDSAYFLKWADLSQLDPDDLKELLLSDGY